jgi:hypothetical protein
MPRSRDVLGGERDRVDVIAAQVCAFAAEMRERFVPERVGCDRFGALDDSTGCRAGLTSGARPARIAHAEQLRRRLRSAFKRGQ